MNNLLTYLDRAMKKMRMMRMTKSLRGKMIAKSKKKRKKMDLIHMLRS